MYSYFSRINFLSSVDEKSHHVRLMTAVQIKAFIIYCRMRCLLICKLYNDAVSKAEFIYCR